MAQFKPYKINRSKLDSLPIKEGQFICFNDSDEMYLDATDSKRISLLSSSVKGVNVSGSTLTITKGDGTAVSIPLAAMAGADSNADGASGLVPTPIAGQQDKYLRGDGTWQSPPNTVYEVATQSINGLLSSTDKEKLDGIAEGANKYTLPTASSSTLGGIKVGSDHDITNGVLTAKVMTGATSTAAGYAGKVPAPSAGSANRYLRSDGNWVVPPDTKYTLDSFGITATADELNKLDGVTTTAQELNYLDGITSNIQTQLNSKVPINRKVNNKPLNADVTLAASDVGAIPTSQKGVANGIAELDENGHVPTSQLPSYVDDVIEGYYKAADGKFYYLSSMTGSTIDGETGKIYIDLNTLKTYRWSGSAFAVISETITLGTTSSTAFRGDQGNTAYQHAAAKGAAFESGLYKITTNAQGHVTAATAVTKADITGLGIPSSDTNTHYASKNVVGAASATANTTSALSNGNVYLNSVENGAVTSSHKISGTGATKVTSDINGNIIITSTDTNTTYNAATISVAGLMSSSDKAKLDSLSANKYLPFSIATAEWKGSGPYTYTLSDDAIIEDTFCIFDFTDISRREILAPISWTTSLGKITLSTDIKPTASLTGHVILISNDIDIEDIKVFEQIANHTYPGIDLTVKFAAEIAGYASPWAWIKARIDAVDFSGLHIGDYIPFTANGGTFQAQIAGIDTYCGYGDVEVKHHIDFISRELWPEGFQMNKVDINNGTSAEKSVPWLASNGYLFVNSLAGQVPNSTTKPFEMVDVDYTSGGMYFYLPDEIKAVIVEKRVCAPSRFSESGVLSNDNRSAWVNMGKLWLPDEYEIAGARLMTSMGWFSGGFVQYPIFAHSMNRLKREQGIGTRSSWWASSAFAGVPTSFSIVSGIGSVDNAAATFRIRAPFCFRVA